MLGFTTAANDVYLVTTGWDFYTGADPSRIGPGQYDFLTLATHELAHTVGLGESSDPGSVMYEYLPAGTVRRDFTDANLSRINTDADRFMKVDAGAAALGANPTSARVRGFRPTTPPLPRQRPVRPGGRSNAGTSSDLGRPQPDRKRPGIAWVPPMAGVFPADLRPGDQAAGRAVQAGRIQQAGGPGDDVFVGWDGADLLVGGFGRDRFRESTEASLPTVSAAIPATSPRSTLSWERSGPRRSARIGWPSALPTPVPAAIPATSPLSTGSWATAGPSRSSRIGSPCIRTARPTWTRGSLPPPSALSGGHHESNGHPPGGTG